ncbi:hypothetical protein [uncultured Gammaproteobacteria bacterium]|nr:hypothetical protein [uncultured Gammaproteobacteria bacterium]
MCFFLAVNNYMFKYFGNVVFDGLFGVACSWFAIQSTSVNVQ